MKITNVFCRLRRVSSRQRARYPSPAQMQRRSPDSDGLCRLGSNSLAAASEPCSRAVWWGTLPVIDASRLTTDSSRKGLTSSRRQVQTGPSPNRPDRNPTLALGDRSMLTLFRSPGEPVGSVEYRIHPLNNKTRQSMRAMFKQVTLQTKESLDNIGTPPRGRSMKRANGSKPTFAKTITS